MNFENQNDTDTAFGDPSPEVIEAVRAADQGDALKLEQLEIPFRAELYTEGGVVKLRLKKK